MAFDNPPPFDFPMERVVEMKKKTRGRQKIQMKMIEDKEDRVITFSKRKTGIFKKASEISVMCGAKVLFILFSPVGKAYSFGHPAVKSVADKFLGREETGGKQIRQILEIHMNNKVDNQVLHHNMIKDEIEAVSEQVSSQSAANKSENKGWWEANINEMKNAEEVELMLKSVLDLELALSNHFENLKLQNVEQGSNMNSVVATHEQLGVMNNFHPQMNDNVEMGDWNGGNLSSASGFGGFDNSFQGLNGAAGLSDYAGEGNAFNLSAAGYGNALGQSSGFGLQADGYDATLDFANDTSGWPGVVGYNGISSGTNAAGPSGVGSSGDVYGDGPFGGDLGGGLYGSGFGGDFGGGLYGSGFGGTFIDELSNPTIGNQGTSSSMP